MQLSLGPYSVCHLHKSTLLIGGLFSFSNSGSSSFNQSNHATGPYPPWIVERGCKLASDSYLLWPAHIGAFNVKGRHSSGRTQGKPFPFSYLVKKMVRLLLSGLYAGICWADPRRREMA